MPGRAKGEERPGCFPLSTCQPECLRLAQGTARRTYKDKLMPTPAQARALATAVLRCRRLGNGALQQRQAWWGRGRGIGASYSQHAAELPALKAACPAYGEVHTQVVQDVLRR